MPSSINRLVAQDHERLDRLLRRARTAGPSQQRWRDELLHLARAHLAAEDEVLDAARQLPGRAHLNELIDRLAIPEPDQERRTRLHDALGAALLEHTHELRERVLATLEQSQPRKEVRRLGGAYAEARDRSLRAQGEAQPPPRRLDVSRAELYELAKKAGIQGRSSMSRRDLIERLQQREQTR